MPRFSQFRRRQSVRSYANYYVAVAKQKLESASTEVVEYYYTARSNGDGFYESPQVDRSPTGGNVIRRKLWYKNEAEANTDDAGWVEFSPQPADDTTYLDAKALILEGLKDSSTGAVPLSLKMTWEDTTP